MKIKLYWPKCNFFWASKRDEIDSFWVECTVREAAHKVFPLLSKKKIIESCISWEPSNPEKKSIFFETDRLCFLISKDLKTIEPCAWYYPHAGQWNGYCPFREIDEIDINNLNEIPNIVTKTEENNDDLN